MVMIAGGNPLKKLEPTQVKQLEDLLLSSEDVFSLGDEDLYRAHLLDDTRSGCSCTHQAGSKVAPFFLVRTCVQDD